MGSKLNLQNESDNIYVQAVHQIGKIFYYRIIRPWTYFNFIFYYLIPKGRLEQKLVKIIHSFTNKVIEKKERNFIKIVETQSESSNGTYNYSGRKKLAMLDLLLNVKLINGTIDDEGIKDEVNTFLFEVTFKGKKIQITNLASFITFRAMILPLWHYVSS